MTQPALNFEDYAGIIKANLYCLDKKIYQVTRDEGGKSIFYTVTKGGEFLGLYRLAVNPKGGIDYGPIQGTGPEWESLCFMLLVMLKRADGTITPEIEAAIPRLQEAYRQRLQEAKPKLPMRKKRPSGRPHKTEDVWAWKELFEKDREKTQVYQEWLAKVKGRNLYDPKRQFDRIAQPGWYKKTK